MLAAYRTRARRFGAVLALLLLPQLALADDSDDRVKPRRAKEIIATMDHQQREPSWTSHFRIKKKHGVQFKRKLRVGDQRLVFSVHGPVLSRKSLGLGFELKF